MYVAKICLNLVPGGINFTLGGWHYDDPPTSGAQNGCHGNGATKSAFYDRRYQKRKDL